MTRSEHPSVGWEDVAAATSDGVAVLEGESFVYVDDRFAELHGREGPDALLGHEWRVLFPPADRDRIESEVLARARERGDWRGDVTVRLPDGRTEGRELSVRRGDGDVFVWAMAGSGPDTPDRAQSDGSYPPFFDDAPDPVGIVTADDGFVYCNPAAVEFLGADGREDVVGRSPGEFVRADDRDEFRDRLDRVVEGPGSAASREEQLVELRSEERVAAVSTVATRYDGDPAALVVLKDVGESDRARARRVGEGRLVQTVIDVLDDVFYVIDEDGEPYLWNEALAQTTGYTDEEIDGMQPEEFIPAADREYAPGLLEAIDAIEDRRVELDLLTKEGERIPHEFRGTTFEDPVTGEVFRCGVARDITERLERERELERYETIVETVEDGVYAMDGDLRFTFVNDGLCEMLGATREELVGTKVTALLSDDDESRRAASVREQVVADEGVGTIPLTTSTPDGERVLESRYRLHPEPADDEFRGSVGVVRDVTEYLARQRELERQRDELATLDRINELLFEVVDELVETTTRDAVLETVCERLASSDLYRLAWTGERGIGGDAIVPRAAAGDEEGYFGSIVDPDTGAVASEGPAGQAMRSGEVRAVNVESAASGRWRDEALERGLESVLAVPLRHRDTVYGVLVVCATRPDAFSEREQDCFAVLGQAVGFAIDAIQRRRLLFADAVTELTFRVVDDESFLARTSLEYDCRVDVIGHVSTGDRWILYLDVDGVAAERIIESAADDPTVVGARAVGDDADTDRLEVVVSGASFMHRTLPTGARVRTIEFEDGVGRVVVDSPAETDTRAVVEQFDATFDTVELLARYDSDRSPQPPLIAGEGLEALTARQREALEVAYRAGYFAWPRRSSSEEVADALDIAGPTFLAHIRKAEKAVFSRLFD